MSETIQPSFNFNDITLAVFGDLMLDKYIYGSVERISAEAPIPIVLVQNEKFVPGGAANVAVNIQTLGGHAKLFGLVGDDDAKNILFDSLHQFNINQENIQVEPNAQTTQKVRIVGQHQQLIRIDYENRQLSTGFAIDHHLDWKHKLKNVNGIVISDYAKGYVNTTLVKTLFVAARQLNIPVFIDPKPVHANIYQGADLVTPNLKEAMLMAGYQEIVSEEDVINIGKQLNERLQSDIIITRGDQGMSIFRKNKEPRHIPTQAREVYDVSGAGDTVIASLALGISSGLDVNSAAVFANIAAGKKVSKVGTAPVFIEEIIDQLHAVI